MHILAFHSFCRAGIGIMLLFLPIIVYAQKRQYQTQKLSGNTLHIDGVIDEAAWELVEWSGEFTQTTPYEKQAPSQPTQFKMLYDDNNLYIAIKAFDSAPDSIVRRMSRRDGFEGDWVEVNIDSYHDLLTAFSFTVSAAGVKGDEKITNNSNFDPNWDPIWYVKTSVDQLGWVAEMRIPFTQLRFGKEEEYVWGLQVSRRLFRKDEKSVWQFISPQASGWVNHFGEIHGIANIQPKKQKDITPYTLGRLETYEKEEGNPYSLGRELSASAGLDSKIGLTNDLTLDITVNPDFGQVEADPSEVNLTTFETYLPEKRMFFIEGRNILSHQITPGGPFYSDNLFYSRRIGKQPSIWPELDDNYNEYADMPDNTTILTAIKLTGKTRKGLSIGLMENLTLEEKAEVAREIPNGTTPSYSYRSEIAEPLTNYLAGRIEQDLNHSNTRVGAMFTATNRNLFTPELMQSLPLSACTGGVNFNHEWKDKTYYLNLNLVASEVHASKEKLSEMQNSSPHYFQRSDAPHIEVDSTKTKLTGTGGSIQLGKAGNGKWRFLSWVTYRSPELNLNDMGYMVRNDEVQEIFWIQYAENAPKGFYRSYSINFNQWVGTTTAPEYLYLGFNLNGGLQYKNHWETWAGFSRDARSVSTQTLRGGPSLLYDGYTDLFVYANTDGRKKIQLGLGASGGAQDGFTTKNQSVYGEIGLQLSDAIKVTLEPAFRTSYDELAYVSNADYQELTRYVRGTINRQESSLVMRFTINLTPDFTIQGYAMPFVSTASYTDFKYITESKAADFDHRFAMYAPEQIRFEDDEYLVDENLDGTSDYSFNPNYKVLDFNSNLVLRWEYLPGSTIYIVWSQNRNSDSTEGTPRLNKDMYNLFYHTYPSNVILIKLSYRIGL
ncbi:MAG: carbohydrate binding family 9 domain-containing protein [Bacteroidota bacterium]|nr:MAG: carbohydrate binding family 9 domain-containing protein [Bacteroidota bacterium]